MLSFAVLATVLAGAVAAAPHIDTPVSPSRKDADRPLTVSQASLVQCQPVSLTFNDGTAPYYLAVIPANQPSAAAVRLTQLDRLSS